MKPGEDLRILPIIYPLYEFGGARFTNSRIPHQNRMNTRFFSLMFIHTLTHPVSSCLLTSCDTYFNGALGAGCRSRCLVAQASTNKSALVNTRQNQKRNKSTSDAQPIDDLPFNWEGCSKASSVIECIRRH